MSKSSHAVKSWRIRTKARIIESMGGRCNICGYNKCNGALELHHIDPHEKELSFGGIRANPKAWDKIVEELKKCVLLCANCHREVEMGVTALPQQINTFDENYSEYKTPPVVYKNNCKNCGIEFIKKEKGLQYCSPVCWSLHNRKVNRPTKEELQLLIQDHSWTSLGKQFGVSDNSVRKWAKSYELI